MQNLLSSERANSVTDSAKYLSLREFTHLDSATICLDIAVMSEAQNRVISAPCKFTLTQSGIVAPADFQLDLTIVSIMPSFMAGATVNVQALLTNNTADTLSGISASETTPGLLFLVAGGTLAPSASTTVSGTYMVTASDESNGSVDLSAIFTANIDGTLDTIDSNEDTATAP